MPVHVAADATRVESDYVYVLPTDVILGIEEAVHQVRRSNAGRCERKPIDIFFSALAVD
jgi:two-component system, chemotaxis family, CheB/CheR fusion protein